MIKKLLAYFGFDPIPFKEFVIGLFLECMLIVAVMYYLLFIY